MNSGHTTEVVLTDEVSGFGRHKARHEFWNGIAKNRLVENIRSGSASNIKKMDGDFMEVRHGKKNSVKMGLTTQQESKLVVLDLMFWRRRR
ncbi:hypothetical protein LWI29_006305 [Acer saccharum]|uniref:Uncharacterized protein n=1 Tax=Acer saccharum TaxID=4024 RepID=A0AA39RVC5_ACESA|nr:hypothetical protein LWI29_006305 [Acer saccharum]